MHLPNMYLAPIHHSPAAEDYLSDHNRQKSLLWGVYHLLSTLWLPRWRSSKESACQCRRRKRQEINPWVGQISWSRKWQATPTFFPGKSHGQKNLASYSPGGCKAGHEWAHTFVKNYKADRNEWGGSSDRAWRPSYPNFFNTSKLQVL